MSKGFTLAEILLVVAVLSVLMVLALPEVTRFSSQSTSLREDIDMDNLSKALFAFMEENDGQLPPTNSWVADLAPYTDLSPNEIQFNRWYYPRYYRAVSQTEPVLNATLNFVPTHAIIYSYGADGEIDADVMAGNFLGTLEPSNATDALANFGGGVAAVIDSYNGIEVGLGDDRVVKVSSRPFLLERALVDVNRLQTINTSLEQFENNAVLASAAAGTYDVNTLYVPPAAPIAGVTYDASVVARSNAHGYNLATPMTNGNANAAEIADRRESMLALVRMLGLPDDYCCSQLTGAPFFYYANFRRVDSSGACAARRTTPPFPKAYVGLERTCD